MPVIAPAPGALGRSERRRGAGSASSAVTAAQVVVIGRHAPGSTRVVRSTTAAQAT